MAVGVYNFEWPQGDTLDLTFTWYDKNQDLVPLTNYTAKMHLRQNISDDEYALELSTENGRISLNAATGEITLNVSAEDMAALEATSYKYDLEMIVNGVVTKLLKGKIKIVAEVTRDDS